MARGIVRVAVQWRQALSAWTGHAVVLPTKVPLLLRALWSCAHTGTQTTRRAHTCVCVSARTHVRMSGRNVCECVCKRACGMCVCEV